MCEFEGLLNLSIAGVEDPGSSRIGQNIPGFELEGCCLEETVHAWGHPSL